MSSMQDPIRLAVVCDFLEEGWPSMDLFGEMILAQLAGDHAGEVVATQVRPAMRARLGRWPWPADRARRAARNADRALNRFWDYPGALRRLARRGSFDLFHIV